MQYLDSLILRMLTALKTIQVLFKDLILVTEVIDDDFTLGSFILRVLCLERDHGPVNLRLPLKGLELKIKLHFFHLRLVCIILLQDSVHVEPKLICLFLEDRNGRLLSRCQLLTKILRRLLTPNSFRRFLLLNLLRGILF